MKKLLIVFFINLFIISQSYADIIYYDNFESYDTQTITTHDLLDPYHTPPWWKTQIENVGAGDQIAITTGQARAGSKSVQFTWYDGPHVMFRIFDPESTGVLLFDWESEYWIGFSTFIPNDFVIDDNDPTTEYNLIWQLWQSYGACTQPAIRLTLNQDLYRLRIRGDDDSVSCPDTQTTCEFGSITNDKGKWVDWAVNFVPDWTGSNGGKVALYKDGVQVDLSTLSCGVGAATYTGQVGYYTTTSPPYTTFGQYKYNGETGNSIYFDEVRVGGPDNSSLEEVSPGSSNVSISGFNPSDEATGVPVTTDLTWTNGDGVTDVDVYFDDTDCTNQVVNGLDVETYDTGTMDNITTYYWKVVANPDDEAITYPSSGCYTFTTVDPPPDLSGDIYDSSAPTNDYNSGGAPSVYVPTS